ncbi:MAG: condensation domain-containing protein, partial [Halobacteriales archaeon]|nr:condensation domain-containing protein [Halobacteriales archaeon]
DRVLPRARTGPVPLSFAQRRLWTLDQIDGPSSLYNLTEAFVLHGTLRVEALRRALATLLGRHEVLRTTYRLTDDEPIQVAESPDDFTLDWEVVDLSETVDDETVYARIAGDAWRPFDLAHGPLFRARLYRTGDEEHVLLLAMHHTVSDAASMEVVRSEVSRAYAAAVESSRLDLPSLDFQYADFALWQRERLEGERLSELMSYWRTRLADLRRLELPTEHPRPAIQSFRGEIVRAKIPSEVVARLRALARREGTTIFMTLMAAFQGLLARYSGQSDIAVGTPVSGREPSGTEDLVGMFVNTVVIRTRPTPDTPFVDLLAEVRDRTVEARTSQELPFEKLVEELEPERDLARNPLFQVFFALQEPSAHPLDLPGLVVEPYLLDQDTSKFDVSLYLREVGDEGGGRLEGVWEYAVDLFDRSRIEGLHRHFVNLLRSITEDPDA